ncbi:glycosyltransferase family 2 protein [Paraburkholderia sp. J11-2]|uniref:glycosyltransferase family 2 protein n=1 Tax=Paraburkholderia sp. J11-2 TaxID=2805431 RepID=UPI002AB7F2D8|nr:glycosyltransferase family 2 protein [Paraburkholderia sp. J11-2]
MFEPTLTPANDLTLDDGWWISTGADPFFLLDFGSRGMPSGRNVVCLDVEVENGSFSPTLYFDLGAGFSQELVQELPVRPLGTMGVLVALPGNLQKIRLDPMTGQGRFRINSFSFRPVSSLSLAWQRSKPLLRTIGSRPQLIWPYTIQAAKLMKRRGLKGALRHALRDRVSEEQAGGPVSDYGEWVKLYDTLSADDKKKISAHIARFSVSPQISVLVPLYNTPERFLRRCIDSVRAQLYGEWELCLVDDASPESHVQKICEHYVRLDARIRYVRRSANGHIAEATNTALEMATGIFSALLDHDDELAPHALYMIAAELNAQPELDMLFSDEDKIDEQGNRYEPWFKSDWNYDLMLSQNAVVHLAVYRTSILREMGGFRSAFNGSQDYDVTLRFSERTAPARIKHIPFILYHWRAISGSVALAATEKLYPYEAAERSIREHLARMGRNATVEQQRHLGYYQVKWAVAQPEPKVAIIIPTKDKVDLLRVAVSSILGKTTYKNYEILIVNNESVEPATMEYFEEIIQEPSVQLINYNKPYSFAALNNWAVTQTDAPLLGFLNNDIEVIAPEWLGEMVGHALRSEVGSVGAKLLYPNGTIQHSGVVVGIGGLAGHPHVGEPGDTPGYFGRAACTQRYSAVTAACMLMRREVFLEINGFDEVNFAVAFNDVDLGLRLGKAGYANVWTPRALLYHHESASLGLPTNERRRNQFLEECANFRRIWAGAIKNDPFYNPNLTISGGDFRPDFPPRVRKPWLVDGGGYEVETK